MWVILEHGYDPDMRNVDQAPFHKNEAGSKTYGTVVMKGSHKVPLLEGHAATRERFSLSTVTDSNEDRIRNKELPGFEVMFKAAGKVKEKKLQEYAASLKRPFKLSVATGPSGSYKEHDLLTMQDKWLEPWGEGRRWEIWMGDAYAAGLTNNVQRQCWQKGYISLTHGGGASMIAQTNDTELHKPVRAEFCAMQQELILGKTQTAGGGLFECSDEENIMLLATVMGNMTFHLQACKGYKYTGTTVAFDSSEDHMIGKDAKEFWDELGMRERELPPLSRKLKPSMNGGSCTGILRTFKIRSFRTRSTRSTMTCQKVWKMRQPRTQTTVFGKLKTMSQIRRPR